MLASVLMCVVLVVSDGDSLTVRCGDGAAAGPLRVRVAEIDAPELRQAFGRRARQQLAGLCRGQLARIDVRERDAYGRTVAAVACQGEDVAQAQVRSGLAWVAPGYAKGDARLLALQQAARRERIGLWSRPRPTPPWVYRHSR